MPDLDRLRDLTVQVHQPGFDALEETARRRDRRRAATTLAACASAVVVAIGAGLLVTTSGQRTSPPVQEPTDSATPTPSKKATPSPSPRRNRKSLTPREVVTDPSARLRMAAAALGDPDTRFALWEAACEECPPRYPEQRGPTTYLGVALTTDGFRTTTYHRAGFPLRNGLPVRVTSPTDDTFLFADSSNSGSWLLRMDGRFTSVRRTESPIEAGEARRAFECYSRRASVVYTTNWCVIDPATATSYEMPLSWQHSVVPPGLGQEPWGLVGNAFSAPAQGWWDDNGSRRTAPLGPGRVLPVRDHSGSGPMFWRRARGSDTLDLLDVQGRSASVQRVTRDAPPGGSVLEVARTPDGALLAWTTPPRVRIWRADDVASGDFVQVYRSAVSRPEGAGVETLSVLGDRLQIDGSAGVVLESTDDGRTWTEMTPWR